MKNRCKVTFGSLVLAAAVSMIAGHFFGFARNNVFSDFSLNQHGPMLFLLAVSVYMIDGIAKSMFSARQPIRITPGVKNETNATRIASGLIWLPIFCVVMGVAAALLTGISDVLNVRIILLIAILLMIVISTLIANGDIGIVMVKSVFLGMVSFSFFASDDVLVTILFIGSMFYVLSTLAVVMINK